jgi:hypothetical protein
MMLNYALALSAAALILLTGIFNLVGGFGGL